MSEDRVFEATEENLAHALELAERSSHVVGYGSDDVSPHDLETALAKDGPGPVWFCWNGTKADALYVAITGNGPTSRHNAAFISCAREVVIGLVAEVNRLRATLREQREDAADRALERDMGA